MSHKGNVKGRPVKFAKPKARGTKMGLKSLRSFKPASVAKFGTVARTGALGVGLVVGAGAIAASVIRTEGKRAVKAISQRSGESRIRSESLRKQIRKVSRKGVGKRIARATTIRR